MRCMEPGMVEGHYSRILTPTFCLLSCENTGASEDVYENKGEQNQGIRFHGPGAIHSAGSHAWGIVLNFGFKLLHLNSKNEGTSGDVDENKGGQEKVSSLRGQVRGTPRGSPRSGHRSDQVSSGGRLG